jgi:hypothetical protein
MVKKIEPVEHHGEKSVLFGVVVRLKIQGVGKLGLDDDTVDGGEREARQVPRRREVRNHQ